MFAIIFIKEGQGRTILMTPVGFPESRKPSKKALTLLLKKRI